MSGPARDRGAGAALKVGMAVASGIAWDSRVKKTALAVAAAGHDVTLLYGRDQPGRQLVGRLGPVSTVGLSVAYELRDKLAAKPRPFSPIRLGMYTDDAEMRIALLQGELRAMRSAHAPLRERLTAALGLRVARWRAEQHDAHRATLDDEEARRSAVAEEEGEAPVDWRTDLPNAGDLTLAFTRSLWRTDPDVLHIHDVHVLEAGVLAARRLRAQGREVAVVYDAHEYVPGMAATGPQVADAWRAAEAELIREVDAVVTVSDPIADALQERYGLRRRPVVSLNSPSLRDQRPCASDVRTAAGVPDGTTLLVYSGVINPRRGVVTVLEGLTGLPDVHVAVVSVPGAGSPAAAALHAHAVQLGVGDRVHLVDPVDTDEIIAFLRTADVGVHAMIGGLPNHEMALPNKLFDYLYAGLPVVVSDVREMGRFVRERGLGATFVPQDADDFARAVGDVTADLAALRARVDDPALREEFAWEAQAARLAALYAELGAELRARRSGGTAALRVVPRRVAARGLGTVRGLVARAGARRG